MRSGHCQQHEDCRNANINKDSGCTCKCRECGIERDAEGGHYEFWRPGVMIGKFFTEDHVRKLMDIIDTLHGYACDCGGGGMCVSCKLFDKSLAMSKTPPPQMLDEVKPVTEEQLKQMAVKCGVWEPGFGPCVATLPCKAHPGSDDMGDFCKHVWACTQRCPDCGKIRRPLGGDTQK